MFEKSKTMMYARRVIVLDNLTTHGFNKQLSHALVVLNSYKTVIEGIDIFDASKDNDDDNHYVQIKLTIRCRCVDWARIEDNLHQYVYKRCEKLDDISTDIF